MAQLVECSSNLHKILGAITAHHISEHVVHIVKMGDGEKIRSSRSSLATERAQIKPKLYESLFQKPVVLNYPCNKLFLYCTTSSSY